MAEDTETETEMVLGEGRLGENTVGRFAGEVLWPREPGPPSKVKLGSAMKDVLRSVLAAGPTGLTVRHQSNVGAALEFGVSHYRKRPERDPGLHDSARRSRQATAKTMSAAGLLIVERGISSEGDDFVSFTLTTAGREAAEKLTGQKVGQDLDELASRPWILTYRHCAIATDQDRRLGATAPHDAGAECFGLATWPDERTAIHTTVGPEFNNQKITVRVGSKIAPADAIQSYRLRSSGTDLSDENSREPQTVPIDRDGLADDLDRTTRFLSENRVHPHPTEPFHVEAALQFLTARDLASVLVWLEEEGGKEASDYARNLMMTSGKTGVELVLGLLLWMTANTWAGNALGARRSWAYMQVRRFAAMTLQSVIDLDTLQIAGSMARNKVPSNDETPDAAAGGSED